jgi:hypothetical protein
MDAELSAVRADRRLGERYLLCFVQLALVTVSRSSCLSLAGDLEVES